MSEIHEIYERVIHQKHKVFFGTHGLTITEANHKANLLKELADGMAAELEATAAYTGVLYFENDERVRTDAFKPINLNEAVLLEGGLNALTAWLREAIKAKERMLLDIRTMPITKFLPEGEALPEFIEQFPLRKSLSMTQLNEDDIIGGFNIAERAEYYSTEAKAASLGKKLHNSGIISRIRKDLQKQKLSEFKTLNSGVGKKDYVVKYTELYDLEEIDELFFELQEQHRTFEERLNYFKARIKNDLTMANAKIAETYSNAIRNEETAYAALLSDYTSKKVAHDARILEITTILESKRLHLTKYVSNIKVIIPNDLLPIIELLSQKK